MPTISLAVLPTDSQTDGRTDIITEFGVAIKKTSRSIIQASFYL